MCQISQLIILWYMHVSCNPDLASVLNFHIYAGVPTLWQSSSHWYVAANASSDYCSHCLDSLWYKLWSISIAKQSRHTIKVNSEVAIIFYRVYLLFSLETTNCPNIILLYRTTYRVWGFAKYPCVHSPFISLCSLSSHCLRSIVTLSSWRPGHVQGGSPDHLTLPFYFHQSMDYNLLFPDDDQCSVWISSFALAGFLLDLSASNHTHDGSVHTQCK